METLEKPELPEDIISLLILYSTKTMLVSKFCKKVWDDRTIKINWGETDLSAISDIQILRNRILKILPTKKYGITVLPSKDSEDLKKLARLIDNAEYLSTFATLLLGGDFTTSNLKIISLQNGTSNLLVSKFSKKNIECRDFNLHVSFHIPEIVVRYTTPQQLRVLKDYIRSLSDDRIYEKGMNHFSFEFRNNSRKLYYNIISAKHLMDLGDIENVIIWLDMIIIEDVFEILAGYNNISTIVIKQDLKRIPDTTLEQLKSLVPFADVTLRNS